MVFFEPNPVGTAQRWPGPFSEQGHPVHFERQPDDPVWQLPAWEHLIRPEKREENRSV
jgi:hypothetical protein